MKNIMSVLGLALLMTISPVLAESSKTVMPNGGWDAAWSPDGSTIAFTSCSPHAIPNLWVIKADKTGLRQMTSRGAHEPTWLPDGKTIVFGTIRGGQSVYMSIGANDEPGSEKPVEALPLGSEDPHWSPDGSLVAYGVVSKDGIARDLKFARAGGGGSNGLTTNFWCREWTWSPDGNTIAFVVGKSTGTSLWIANVATKEVKLLYKGFCSAPAYSPDGKRIALARPDVRSGFKPVIIDLETGLDKLIGVKSFDGQRLIWSRDGKKLFFESSPKSEPAIWSVGTDGKNVTRVTAEKTPSMLPSFSPDGSKFVCQVINPGSYSMELSICSTSGVTLTKLTSSTRPSCWSPVWRPDGKQFAFLSDKNHSTEIFLGSPEGRMSKALAPVNYPGPLGLSWFPDGNKLLVADGGRLLALNRTGGKDAAKPLPNLSTQVQGGSFNGDEVIVTEWGIRDAAISAFKLDGSSKRHLTQKPQPPPEPQPLDAEKKPADPATVSKPDEPSSAVTDPSQHSGAGPVTDAEVGNPHSELGLMGPQANVSSKKPAIVDLWPAVSPDQKSVVFARSDQIWLVNIDGTGERQITKFVPREGIKHTIMNPCWSPDGQSILFTAITNGANKLTLEIWLCGLEAESERLVYSEDVHTEYGVYYSECTNPPIFMPEGKRILFTSISGDQPRIVSTDLSGGDIREIVPAPSIFPSLDVSGKKLAYVDLSNQQERIWVMDIETGRRTGPLSGK
ncbi:MAG: TolB family protein [Armatimonadota bacterium]